MRSWWDSHGQGISPRQRSLPNNTQYAQETESNGSAGIRTRNPSKREATGISFRLRGHRDWQRQVQNKNKNIFLINVFKSVKDVFTLWMFL
jgi:hypothetical protein